jgi:CubicO group peptidase (beta-lactamase class C family)
MIPAVLMRSLLPLLLLTAGQPAEDQPPAAGDSDVCAILIRALRDHPVPALGAAIVRSHQPPVIGVAGWRKRGDPTPVTVADTWHLGSCTKAMTAVLAAWLIAQGDLSWDATLAQSFPDLAPVMLPGWPETTLMALLQHRSGAPANLAWSTLADRPAAVRSATTAPRGQAGAYLYSNTGYVLAGAMIEHAGHGRWESLLVEHVWKPLGMHGGFGGMGTAGLVDQPWGHTATGQSAGNGPHADNPEVMGPAGRVHMALTDWSLFIADQLRGERGDPALLPTAFYHQMHQPFPVAPGSTDDVYACGWEVVSRAWSPGPVYTHNGTNTMHYAVVWMAPSSDLSVLVVCNQGDAAAACDAVAWPLIQRAVRK